MVLSSDNISRFKAFNIQEQVFGVCAGAAPVAQGNWLYQSQMARDQGTETGSGQTQAYSEKQNGNWRLYLEPVWERTPAATANPPYFEKPQKWPQSPIQHRLSTSPWKVYFIHILQPAKLTLTIKRYLPPPILKITQRPTMSAVPNVFLSS